MSMTRRFLLREVTEAMGLAMHHLRQAERLSNERLLFRYLDLVVMELKRIDANKESDPNRTRRRAKIQSRAVEEGKQAPVKGEPRAKAQE